MDERGVLRALTQYDVDYKYTTPDGWAMCSCPLAPYKIEHRKGTDSKPSFGVHIDEDDVSRYHCFTCKAKGTLGGLGMLLGKFREEPDLLALGKKIDNDDILGGGVDYEWQEGRNPKDNATYRNQTFPSEREFEDRFARTLANPKASGYLRRRGISPSTAFALGLRYDPKQRRILFPVYDYWTGRYAGCSGRSTLSARALDELEQSSGRPQPKVRDYFGLEKDKLLLGKRNLRNAASDGLSGDRGQFGTSTHRPRFLIGVEGLFAFGRLYERGYGANVFALLGSELLEGKARIIEDIALPVFWFTDDDAAGRSCLYGRMDEHTEDHKGGGALDRLYHSIAQFVPRWPEGKDDPDDLTKYEIDQMLEEAELYARDTH